MCFISRLKPLRLSYAKDYHINRSLTKDILTRVLTGLESLLGCVKLVCICPVWNFQIVGERRSPGALEPATET